MWSLMKDSVTLMILFINRSFGLVSTNALLILGQVLPPDMIYEKCGWEVRFIQE